MNSHLPGLPPGHVEVNGIGGCPKGPASEGEYGVCVQLSVGPHVTSWHLCHFNLSIVLAFCSMLGKKEPHTN